jgi:hypothetical protein
LFFFLDRWLCLLVMSSRRFEEPYLVPQGSFQ